MRSKSRTTSPRSRIFRSSICRRLNASSWRLSEAPCCAAFWMASRSSRVSLPGAASSSRISEKPRMAVRMLLKSCATPPASWPMLSIRCTCCSACSMRRRSVTSRPVSRTPPMSVRPARLVTPISSSRQSPLRGRTRSWCACSGPPRRSAPRRNASVVAGVLGVHDVEAPAADQLARQVVEQVADRRADVADDERVVDHHDDVGDVLEEELRPLLALPQRFFGAAPLPALAGAIDRRQQLFRRHRLDQVVVGALPQRAQRALDAGVAGQDDRLGQLGQRR